jgi:hypothetical protein
VTIFYEQSLDAENKELIEITDENFIKNMNKNLDLTV